MRRLGIGLAPLLAPSDTLLIQGTLGAGKTTLTQAIIETLSPVPVSVTSPTFTLVQTYPVAFGDKKSECWHVDLYRLNNASELDEIGLGEAIGTHLCLIEWPEKMGASIPGSRMDIAIRVGSGDSRTLLLALHGEMVRPELKQFMESYA